MTFLRLLAMSSVGLILAFGGLASSAVSASTPASDGRQFEVSTETYPGGSSTAIALATGKAAAVTLAVPRGYVVDLTAKPGTEIGSGAAAFTDAVGESEPQVANGRLFADDPERYAADPVAQACAPGRHAAVWRATFSFGGRTVDVPIFVDPAADGDASASYVLRFCPTWQPSSSRPRGQSMVGMALVVDDVFKEPSARGLHTWSALVDTPASAGTQSFELRSAVPVPNRLTLWAEYSNATQSVVLTGRLTSAGRPQPGRRVTITALRSPFALPTPVARATTNAEGKFSIRTRARTTTQFMAFADVSTSPCRPASSAPGGCVQSVSSPAPVAANVVVRTATDPKLETRRPDQARARRANLRTADFPEGWRGVVPNPFSPSCPPNFSDLVASGEAVSQDFESADAIAYSKSTVYRTEGQARVAFRRAARLDAVRCLVGENGPREGVTVRKLSRISFPRFGSETRAFRVVVAIEGDPVFVDVVYVRVGRLVAQVGFSSLGQPLAIERQLVAKLVARARG